MAPNDYGGPLEGPLVDASMMGRFFRAARIMAGFDSVEEAVAAIREMTGHRISSRTLYAIERGEQPATLEQLLAATMAYRPPGSVVFFNAAYRDDVRLMLESYGREAFRG